MTNPDLLQIKTQRGDYIKLLRGNGRSAIDQNNRLGIDSGVVHMLKSESNAMRTEGIRLARMFEPGPRTQMALAQLISNPDGHIGDQQAQQMLLIRMLRHDSNPRVRLGCRGSSELKTH